MSYHFVCFHRGSSCENGCVERVCGTPLNHWIKAWDSFFSCVQEVYGFSSANPLDCAALHWAYGARMRYTLERQRQGILNLSSHKNGAVTRRFLYDNGLSSIKGASGQGQVDQDAPVGNSIIRSISDDCTSSQDAMVSQSFYLKTILFLAVMCQSNTILPLLLYVYRFNHCQRW